MNPEKTLVQIDLGRDWRGGQRQTFYLCRDLADGGRPITLVARAESALAGKARSIGLRVVEFSSGVPWNPLAIGRLRRELGTARPALVHCHDAHALTLGLLAFPRAGLKIAGRKVNFPLSANPLSRRRYRKSVNALIAVSGAVRSTLINCGIEAEKIRVIHDGIDLPGQVSADLRERGRRELGIPPDSVVAVCIAALTAEKGQADLLEALAAASADLPRLILLLAGEGKLRKELERKILLLGLGEKVRFLGFHPDPGLLLQAADLLVAPSRQEGLGSILLDAQGLGLPVLATRAGGISECVVEGHTGILVAPGDIQALADALILLYRDPGLRRQMGAAGRTHIANSFSTERMVAQTLELYLGLGLPDS